MNITNCLLIAFPLSVMLFGLYLFIKSLRDKPKVTLPSDVYDKNGIPIIPRHLRQVKDDDLSADQPNTKSDTDQNIAQNTNTEGFNNDWLNAHPPADIHLTNEDNQHSDHLQPNLTQKPEFEEYKNETHATPNFLNMDDDTDDWLTINHGDDNNDDNHTSDANQNSFATTTSPYQQSSTYAEQVIHSGNLYDITYTSALDEQDIQDGINEPINHHDDNHLNDQLTSSEPNAEQHINPNPSPNPSPSLHIDTAPVPDFEQASPILDEHLIHDNTAEQDSPLTNASGNLNISILPVNEFGFFRGRTLLNLLDKFGFKFGTMNMFHRYQNKDGTGILWFSMMELTANGIEPFDLNELPNAQLRGVVLFLSLPHPKILQGFDSMMSIANLLARELGGYVVDEHGEMITKEYKLSLRSQLQDIEN